MTLLVVILIVGFLYYSLSPLFITGSSSLGLVKLIFADMVKDGILAKWEKMDAG